MHFNRAQLQQAFEDRHALASYLALGMSMPERVDYFKQRPHVFQGSTWDWVDLAKALEEKRPCRLPPHGHIFIEACVSADYTALLKLLKEFAIDAEQEWDIPEHQRPWSAWLWIASTTCDDGVSPKDLRDQVWGIVLPLLMGTGFDLSRPCAIPLGSQHLTREQWLRLQDNEAFEKALFLAQPLLLDRDTPSSQAPPDRRRL